MSNHTPLVMAGLDPAIHGSPPHEALLDALAEESGEPRPHHLHLRPRSEREAEGDFVTAVLDNLAKAGVQNTKKNERLSLATIPWPGR